VSGGTHFYLGWRYVLKVIQHHSADESVKLLRGRLEVRTRSKEAGKAARCSMAGTASGLRPYSLGA